MHLLLLLASGVLATIGTACLIKANDCTRFAALTRVLRSRPAGTLSTSAFILKGIAALWVISGVLAFALSIICIAQLSGV